MSLLINRLLSNKDKPMCWGIKTFLVWDREHGYIGNAKTYTLATDNIGATGNLTDMMDPFRD